VRPWREELSERLENFRRRRARLRRRIDSSDNLDLDFGQVGDFESPGPLDAKVLEFPQAEAGFDVEFENPPGSESELPVLEAAPLEKAGVEQQTPGSAAVQAREVALERGAPESEPVEIVVGFPELPPEPPPAQASPLALRQAPLGRRFVAGLADTLVLLLGGGLFALIFWRAGGQLSPGPLNLAVLAFIAIFFILAYFGLFTALTSSTPGLLWMGLEVRTMDGLRPSPQESFWRAFGYLVSGSAIMMGFLWALVDSESLTWHDRMSGTFLTRASPESGTQSVKSLV